MSNPGCGHSNPRLISSASYPYWLTYPHTANTCNRMGQTASQQNFNSSEQEIVDHTVQLKKDVDSKVDELFKLLEQQYQINRNLEQTNKQLQSELEKCNEEVRRSSRRKQRQNPEIDRLKEENDDLHKEIVELKRKLRDYEHFRYEKNRLQQENERISNELQMLKQRRQKTVTVQMFSAVNQKLCQLVESELFAMLSTHLETMSINIQKEQCSGPQEHRDNIPLIVLCVNASRLGTDVHQALTNVTSNSSVAVAVLHHKEIHALPAQPSEKLLIGAEYRQLGLIVDIAFLTNKGMYPCEMNNRSVERLSSFISGYSA